MTDLEIADAIRLEYERWDAEDVAANPRPESNKDSVTGLLTRLESLDVDAEDYEADRSHIAAEVDRLIATEAAALDAYGQAREERWAARRAEFLTELGVE